MFNPFNPFINPFGRETSEVPLLREAFADWAIGSGIFDAIESVGNPPWKGSVDSTILDIDYFGNRSGGKFSAPVILNLLGETEELTDENRAILAKVIWAKFSQPWSHLWETNIAAYNPIHNYNMTDTRHLERGDEGNEDGTRTSVDTTTHGRTNEVNDYTYGFNNTDEVGKHSDRSTSQEGGTTRNDGSDTDHRETAASRVEDETITRSGNIGVTTTQQMLTAERELWMWNFFDQVYKDIDSVLALPFYDPCRV